MKDVQRIRTRLAVLAIALLAFVACDQELPTAPAPQPNVTVTQTVIIGQTSPTASPSPSGPPLPPNSTIRVGVFGHDCPSGETPPNNSSGLIRVACRGAAITATPKDASGVDISPLIHGPDIAWTGPTGAAGVSCTPSYLGTTFNQFCSCSVAGGNFTLTATVKGVTGTFVGTCVP